MYDFSGYATKNDLECGDGRIIRRDAFKDNDNTRVPLVWAHVHTDPGSVLGHADLENRDDGVYAYCTLNDTEAGQIAKSLVKHGDVTSMSIYANRLKQQGANVVHGIIREVSLVLAGANPGAVINPLSIAHGDGTYTDLEDEAIIYTGEEFIVHSDDSSSDTKSSESKKDDAKTEEKDKKDEEDMADDSDKTIQDVIDTMNEEQKAVLEYLVDKAYNREMKHSDDDSEDEVDSSEETVEDVLKTFNKKQRMVLEYLVGMAASKKDVKHDDMEDDMKSNVFDNNDSYAELSHDEINSYIAAAKTGSNGSLKQEFLSHGIENLEVLYPEAKLVGQNPELISRDMTWVDKVWGMLRKTPFARIRSVAANITEYEARARGYQKGDQKIEEILSLLARTTTPQTVYKLQKIDRDDVIDITDLDVVAFMKVEMRMMLNEEIVRAVLVGDDRSSSDPSYINPEHIRPIYQDSDVYTIHDKVTIGSSATFNDIADAIIEHAVLSRKNYMGSGTPVMLASTDVITRMLLAKDQLGHRMYRNEGELAAALRVQEIIEVPIFDGITRTASVSTTTEGTTVTTQEERKLLALIVNLNDYALGADKGGNVNLFDDFDLNFNKYEYLIETRVSGALTKPYSAIAIETSGDLPFSFGTVSGMYSSRRTGTTGATGSTGA
jgi:HK97 family phage prohead protease